MAYQTRYFEDAYEFVNWLRSLGQFEKFWAYLSSIGQTTFYDLTKIQPDQLIKLIRTWNNYLGIYEYQEPGYAIIPGGTSPLPYSCNFCGKQFATNEERLAHEQSAHPVSPTIFTCPVCGLTFNTDQQLQVHAQTHATTPPVYTCSVCGLPFSTWTEKEAHEKTHIPTVYKCKYCGQEFATLDLANAHIKAVHPDGSPTTPPVGAAAGMAVLTLAGAWALFSRRKRK